MEELAARFREELSRPLVNFTHAEKGPWAAIWDQGRGRSQRIPYDLAVTATGDQREQILNSAREYEGIAAASRSDA